MSVRRLGLDELDPQLQGLLAPRIDRLGYLGEFFQVTAHQPEALSAFIHFTEALRLALPVDLYEVVALSVATRLENAYERLQHERLCATLGFGASWIADVVRLEPQSAVALDERQRAVQHLALAVVDGLGHDVRHIVEGVVSLVSDAEAVALVMTVARYLAHAVLVEVFEITPPAAIGSS